MSGAIQCLGLLSLAMSVSAAALGAYNIDPQSVSVSGISSGGYFASQLGIAHSEVFKTGFGVFAGGPFDCARNQAYYSCMYNGHPSITTSVQNMRAWDSNEIDPLSNLKDRKIYMQVGSSDTTTGPSVQDQLRQQLANFYDQAKVSYVTTDGAAHTFPTDFDATGNSACSFSSSPFVSNCGYDGAGGVLQWMYSDLSPRNDGAATGQVISFDQTGEYTSLGMDSTGYLYVPQACSSGGSTSCRLHVALHGCNQGHFKVGNAFINNSGFNRWADTNNIIILYPQAVADNQIRQTWSGLLSNPNGCWDWVGWYGANADQKGGVQMEAVVNQVQQIVRWFSQIL